MAPLDGKDRMNQGIPRSRVLEVGFFEKALHTEPRAAASDPLSKTRLDREHQVHKPPRKKQIALATNLVFPASLFPSELVARLRSRLGIGR